MSTTASVSPAARIRGFTYAIRNIVAEAKAVEASGRQVRYLNIGDPIPFGFHTPPHLVDAVARAMRDGHNGYTPSPGILPAREAVAAEYERRGMPVSVDRIILTSGTSEGIELALGALADLSFVHGRAGQARRARRVLPHRPVTRLDAGSGRRQAASQSGHARAGFD
jgi:hypothetical protein